MFKNIHFDDSLKIIFFIETVLFVLLFGGIYQSNQMALLVIKILLPFVLLMSASLLLTRKRNLLMLNFLGMITLGLVLKFLMIISSPAPTIDVYDMLKIGPSYFISGKNPYIEYYPKMYTGVVPNYFTYFPFMLIFFLPADLLFKEPRYTFILVDLITVILLFKILDNSKQNVAKYFLPLLFLYHPSSSFILEQSWVDTLIFMLLVLFLYLKNYPSRLSRFSSLVLALFLGTKQSMLIFAPFMMLFKKIRFKEIAIALLLVVFSVVPFLVQSPRDFYLDTIKFFLDYPSRYDSITFNSFSFLLTGNDLPRVIMYVIWASLGFLIAMVIRRSLSWYVFILSMALFIFGFYFFNKLAFVHYYYLVSCLMLLGVAIGISKVR